MKWHDISFNLADRFFMGAKAETGCYSRQHQCHGSECSCSREMMSSHLERGRKVNLAHLIAAGVAVGKLIAEILRSDTMIVCVIYASQIPTPGIFYQPALEVQISAPSSVECSQHFLFFII